MAMDESQALQETISILETIPGGRAVIEWFGGQPEFGDAEILELRLVRRGPSVLRVSATASENRRGPPFRHAVFEFTLRDTIDVHLDGFSHQNVIGGLRLRAAKDQPAHPGVRGIGVARGVVELEVTPCAGAHGMVRCTVEKIAITRVENYQTADKDQ